MKKSAIISLICLLIMEAIGQTPTLSPFPLSAVRLLESPFKKAQQTDAQYILALDPDRLLAPFLKDAGIPPLKNNYGNWENTGLDGHIAGHYLSALSNMYAATGDKVFLDRLHYMLNWLDSCQQKNGDGYVGGIPNGKQMWSAIANGNVSAIKDRWVPWYNLHKTFAGLVDAYWLTGSAQAKDILVKLSDWCLQLTARLTDQQMEEMLAVEHGGMNDALANVAMITNDQKYLTLARKFSHKAILDPLLQQKDALTGLHANTQIPKVTGFMQVAAVSNDGPWADAAAFFWNTVVQHRSIAIGGNSVKEHFNAVNDFHSMLETAEGPETCNSYNMLKLTKLLFLAAPSAKYMDYYERTLYNHILSSQHPRGGFVYFTPIHPLHYRVYSSPQQSFWCCVGTGMENPGRFGEMIYAHTNTALYVNLFIPSIVQWKEKGITLTQKTAFPFEESSQLTISTNTPQQLTIQLRKPSWLKGNAILKVNGKPVKVAADAQSYWSLNRVWKTGDHITIQLPMKTYYEQLPDKSRWLSFVHGPIVLAAIADTNKLAGLHADDGRWSHIANGAMEPLNEAPKLTMEHPQNAAMPVPISKERLEFSAAHLIAQEKYRHLKLIPFFQLHDARYVLYWPY